MIGLGYDSHKLQRNKPLMIGGIRIESEFGAVSNSDGDVLLHALCDALLGAAGLGDLGDHFPDNANMFENTESREFVLEIMELIRVNNYSIVNIDVTIILEEPKLKSHKLIIKNHIAELCKISPEQVNIKAKTNEKMGFLGRMEGIAALCICELQKI